MAMRDDYRAFLQARLGSRIEDLRAALAPLVDNPPPAECRVEIMLFPDDGVTERPPIMIHVFGPDGACASDTHGVARSNELLTSMSPLMSTDEVDRFYVWEGEGPDRMIALEQPIDGVNEEVLRSWIGTAWRGLEKRNYRCETALVVHDDDGTELLLGA